jgi:hypothetical protein
MGVYVQGKQAVIYSHVWLRDVSVHRPSKLSRSREICRVLRKRTFEVKLKILADKHNYFHNTNKISKSPMNHSNLSDGTSCSSRWLITIAALDTIIVAVHFNAIIS